jgi:hypothetical protein
MRPTFALAFALTLAALLAGGYAAAAEPAYHLYRTHLTPPAGNVRPRASTIEYFGGPVISTVHVEVVIWGSKVASSTVTSIGPFLKSLANSTFTDLLGQYATDLTGVNGHAGTDQQIKRGSLLGQVQIVPKNTSTKLSDAAIQAEIIHQITVGKLPRRGPNILYMVFFPASITITIDGSTSCTDFGAYHEASPGNPAKSNFWYGVMPDCGGGFTSLTYATSHEFAEAVTDAIPTPGSHPAYPQAWNTADGYEIADLCEGLSATLTAGKAVFTVTEVFDKKTNACATGNYTSP